MLEPDDKTLEILKGERKLEHQPGPLFLASFFLSRAAMLADSVAQNNTGDTVGCQGNRCTKKQRSKLTFAFGRENVRRLSKQGRDMAEIFQGSKDASRMNQKVRTPAGRRSVSG
jgi:hypothetical protein